LITNRRTPVFLHLFFLVLCTLMLLPLLSVFTISVSDDVEIIKAGGYSLLPRGEWKWDAYNLIFKNPYQILQAYQVTLLVTVIGTAGSVLLVSGLAYTLSRRDYRRRKAVSFYLFFTMLFSGGLVPFYILVARVLDWRDSYFALIVPALINVWNVFVLRTNFQRIPGELIESAKMDGASEFRILFQIILPVATPAMATIALFTAFGYWNDWWLGLLFINKPDMNPLQLLLKNMLSNIEVVLARMNDMPQSLRAANLVPTEAIRMAMCLIAAGPMLLAFPFFQKYFVKGLTVGAVKG